ncbi:hypothetical protein [Gluconobacter wancherniae]|uniref:hypothetical protein n=1 Tax=Gluconobacter wancherniae TaxID=1307955 RepID=UPI001B8CC88B|nr:hypothetical protein [Gluconobacter wancherniae]MBS1089901.1 hypothetical protein [Gluconobacter wancherniae]
MSVSGIVPEADIEANIGSLLSESGSSRIVYLFNGDDDLVIKEGRSTPFAANWKEWRIWDEIVGSEMADMFAECRAISTTGKYLVMERLDTDLGNRERPATPVWLTDRKSSCLGVSSKGAVKVLDYGQSNDFEGLRSEAPLQPWPSSSEVNQIDDIMRKLGDDPFGFGSD